MRRIAALICSCGLLVAFGCSRLYDERMDKTIEKRRYEKRLNDNLLPAIAEGKLKELMVYARPPKQLAAAKEFGLGEVQPGVFDETKTYFEGTKTFLHMIVRKKPVKKAAVKGVPAEPPVQRGPFNADVFAVLKAAYGDEETIAPEKLKTFSDYKPNTFSRLIFELGEDAAKKRVEVYIMKQGDYDIAMIFQYDPADKAKMATQIQLCLESLAVDARARASFAKASGAEEEEGAEGAGGGAATF